MEKEQQKRDYDSALARLQEILSLLEGDEVVSLEQYKQLAAEAKTLLAYCRQRLTEIEKEVAEIKFE